MTTYWMHIGPEDPGGWYIYKVALGRVYMLDMYSKKWDKTTFSAGYPSKAEGYAQVPDSILLIMGIPP